MLTRRDRVADAVDDRSLAAAVRAAAVELAWEFPRFLAVAAGWLGVAGVALALGRAHPLFQLSAVLLVPLTGALMRMAAVTVRGRPVRVHDAVDGCRHRWRVVLPLAVAQTVALFVAGLNVDLGLTVGSLPLVLAALVSAQLAIAVVAVALCCWPLLYDPARDDLPLRTLLLQGLGGLARRPGRIVGLVVLLAVVGAVSLQATVAALVALPFAVLVTAHAVVPVADRHMVAGGR